MKSFLINYNISEKKLLKFLAKEKLSLSHDFDHLHRVADYCFWLAKKYHGNRKIVIASALLHDLGRNNLKYRGKTSAKKGAELARPLLKKAGYSSWEIKQIFKCIAEHDQPELESDLLEAQILKEADFLDGFGARSLLRSILYAGETKEGREKAIDRLINKGRKRFESLKFAPSRRLAWRLHQLTELVVKELQNFYNLSDYDYQGKLIVFEGISGSGKDTQAKLLVDYLKAWGKKAILVNHPTDFFKKIWRLWRSQVDNRASEMFLLLGDRIRIVNEKILPALKKGTIVVSTRSTIDIQIYQQWPGLSLQFYRFIAAFEPIADMFIYLDIGAEEAWRRTNQRVKKGLEKDRGFFGSKQKQQLKMFKKVLAFYPNMFQIDASLGKKAVFSQVAACVKQKFSLR